MHSGQKQSAVRPVEFSALRIICFVNFVEIFNLLKFHFPIRIDYLIIMSTERLNLILPNPFIYLVDKHDMSIANFHFFQ